MTLRRLVFVADHANNKECCLTRLTEKLVLEMYAEGQTLKGADLQGLNLNRTVMPGIDLSDADLRGANLDAVDLSSVVLDGALLSGARFCNTIMPDKSVLYTGC